jgi:hypothetical protein
MTVFLKFPDEATAISVLTGAGLRIDYQFDPAANYSIDMIGTLPGFTGYHVNFAGDIRPAFVQYLVFPTQPRVLFAGRAPIPDPTFLGDDGVSLYIEIDGVVYQYQPG